MLLRTPEGLLNECFLIRKDNRDVPVSRNGLKLNELPEISIIGTGSSKILNLRKDVQVKPIRGNIHTRLKKFDDGEYDAIVFVATRLKRAELYSEFTSKGKNKTYFTTFVELKIRNTLSQPYSLYPQFHYV